MLEVLGSGAMEGCGDWEAVAEALRNTARDVLGETSGKGGRADRDTWWWKKEVQDSVKAKKEAKNYGIPPETRLPRRSIKERERR